MSISDYFSEELTQWKREDDGLLPVEGSQNEFFLENPFSSEELQSRVDHVFDETLTRAGESPYASSPSSVAAYLGSPPANVPSQGALNEDLGSEQPAPPPQKIRRITDHAQTVSSSSSARQINPLKEIRHFIMNRRVFRDQEQRAFSDLCGLIDFNTIPDSELKELFDVFFTKYFRVEFAKGRGPALTVFAEFLNCSLCRTENKRAIEIKELILGLSIGLSKETCSKVWVCCNPIFESFGVSGGRSWMDSFDHQNRLQADNQPAVSVQLQEEMFRLAENKFTHRRQRERFVQLCGLIEFEKLGDEGLERLFRSFFKRHLIAAEQIVAGKPFSPLKLLENLLTFSIIRLDKKGQTKIRRIISQLLNEIPPEIRAQVKGSCWTHFQRKGCHFRRAPAASANINTALNQPLPPLGRENEEALLLDKTDEADNQPVVPLDLNEPAAASIAPAGVGQPPF